MMAAKEERKRTEPNVHLWRFVSDPTVVADGMLIITALLGGVLGGLSLTGSPRNLHPGRLRVKVPLAGSQPRLLVAVQR